jgi:hypothetical protein
MLGACMHLGSASSAERRKSVEILRDYILLCPPWRQQPSICAETISIYIHGQTRAKCANITIVRFLNYPYRDFANLNNQKTETLY